MALKSSPSILRILLQDAPYKNSERNRDIMKYLNNNYLIKLLLNIAPKCKLPIWASDKRVTVLGPDLNKSTISECGAKRTGILVFPGYSCQTLVASCWFKMHAKMCKN